MSLIKKLIKKLTYRDLDISESGIIDDIRELNEKYIKLFIDLHNHESIVDETFYLAAQKALTDQYKTELNLKIAQAKVKTNEKFYLAQRKSGVLGLYQYRRRFKWYDSEMKEVLDERADREAAGHLAELIGGIAPSEEEPEEEIKEDPTAEPKNSDVEDPKEELAVDSDEANEPDDLDALYELEDEVDEDAPNEDPEEEDPEDPVEGFAEDPDEKPEEIIIPSAAVTYTFTPQGAPEPSNGEEVGIEQKAAENASEEQEE